MTKWTPGPWECNGFLIVGPHHKSLGRKRIICEMVHDTGTHIHELTATRKLIKAAPAMFKALERLAKAADDLGHGYLSKAVDEAYEALELADPKYENH